MVPKVTRSQNTPTFTGFDNVNSDVPVFDPWRYIVGLDGPGEIAGVPRPSTTVTDDSGTVSTNPFSGIATMFASVNTTAGTDHLSGLASMFASINSANTTASSGVDHLSGVASLFASTMSTIASVVTGSSVGSDGSIETESSDESRQVEATSDRSNPDVAVDRQVEDNLSVRTAWTGTPLAPGWNNAFPRVSTPATSVGSDIEELSPEYQLHRELLDS